MARNASCFVNFQTVELSKTLFSVQQASAVLDVSGALTTPNTTLDSQPQIKSEQTVLHPG